MSQSASNITTLITGPFHSLSHLSSLWSIQPVPPNMYHTKAISTLTGTYLPLGGVLLRDTGVTTRIRTHTLLNRNTRAWVWCSYNADLLDLHIPKRQNINRTHCIQKSDRCENCLRWRTVGVNFHVGGVYCRKCLGNQDAFEMINASSHKCNDVTYQQFFFLSRQQNPLLHSVSE